MSVVAIIPARGGSKSVPGKNIKLLAGKPLIAYTIESALACSQLDRVIVSTDDEKIAKVAQDQGAEVPFIRPAKLAQDTSPTLPVLQHAVEFLERSEGIRIDPIVLLDPTTPFRRVADIESCLRELKENPQADSVETVCEVEYNPYSVMVELDGKRMVPLMKGVFETITRRQDAPKVYRENAAVFVVRREVLMERNMLFTEQTYAVEMPQERSMHIDHPLDFEIADYLLGRNLVDL